MHFTFDWDPAKESINIRKHKVGFRQAATIFRDPNQLSLFDKEHSDYEDRWITLGMDESGMLRVVIHTFEQISEGMYNIRVISARRATSSEINQYREGVES